MSESTPDRDSSAVALATAKSEFDAGRFEFALEHVMAILARDPSHDAAKRLQAKVHTRQQRWAEAIAAYDALSARESLEVADLRELINCCRKLGDLQGGLDRAQALITRFGPRTDLRLDLADLLRDLGRLAEAEAAYAQIVADDPRSVTAHLRLGYSLRARLGPGSGVPHFRAAHAIAPEDRWAWLALADNLRDAGAFEDAKREYQCLLETIPAFFQAHLGLGYLVRRQSGSTQALPHFEAALQVAPKDRWARLAVADTVREVGKTEEAETLFLDLARDEPEFHHAHLGVAHCVRKRAGMLQAFSHFERALSLAPQDPWCRFYVADGLRETGRVQEAEHAFKAMIAAGALPVQARIGLAQCLRKDRRTDEAIEALRAALEHSPQDRRVRATILDYLSEQQRWDEAIERVEQWLAEDPESADSHLAKARILRRRDGLAAALPSYRAAAERLAEDSGALRECAAAFREFDDLPQAEAIYARLILRNPKDTHARIGLAQCSFARGLRPTAMVQLADCIDAGFPDKHAALETARLAREWSNLDLARRALDTASNGFLRDDPDLLSATAALESAAGDSSAAIAAYRSAIAAAPDRHEIALALASEQLASGDIAGSDETLAQLCAIENLPSDVLARIAEHHMRCGLDSTALDYAIEAYESDSRGPAAVMTLARAMAHMGRVDSALEVLEEGAEQFGARPEFYALGSVILREHGRVDGARALLSEFLGRQSPTAWILFELAQIELAAGAHEAASQCLDRIRANSRADLAQVRFLRAQMAIDSWQLESALAQLEEAVREHPQMGHAHHSLAICCLLLGRTEQARMHLQAFTDAEIPLRRARGRPLSTWYSQLGQLLDEYSFDRAALANLEALSARPPQERLEGLRAVGADLLQHTPSAISLLVTLREAGMLDVRNADAAASAAIPPVLMQFWHEGEPPDDLEPYLASWQALNPDLSYCLLDDTAAQDFLQTHCEPVVLEAYRRANEPTKRADLIRLAWLFIHGGFYADADDVCLRPIREFVPAGIRFATSQESYGTLLNNFIGVVPRHPVIAKALDAAVEATNRGDADRLWLSTGPALLTRAFAARWASSIEAGDQLLATSLVMTRRELAQYITAHCQAGYKRNPRHWSLVEPRLNRRRTDWSRLPATVDESDQ